jgi:predicted N-acetyltransferase YhbS
MDYAIRNEKAEDYVMVENITRRAFWNMHAPGCTEHYLAHTMRGHQDFIPELDFVLEADGKIIGNIMYAKSRLVSESGVEEEVLTFGPVSILPEYQRRGLGRKLMEHSFLKAKGMCWKTIVIFGHPGNYVPLGFKSCRRFDISVGDGIYPTALLVLELQANALPLGKWTFHESEAYRVDDEKAAQFDQGFERLEKKELPCQEEFYIYSRSRIID